MPKKDNIGYWFRYGEFEGGVAVPEEYPKPGIFHDELKGIFKKTNFDGIADEQELGLRIRVLREKNLKLEATVEEHVKAGKMWAFSDLKTWMAEKKSKVQTSSLKLRDEVKNKTEEEAPLKDDKQGTTKVPSALPKGDGPPPKQTGQLENQNSMEVDTFLLEYDRRLSKEISILKKEKKEKKKKLEGYKEIVFRKGSEEVNLKGKEEANERKMAQNYKLLEKVKKLKIKKAILEDRVPAEEKLKKLQENILKVKQEVENGMAKMKANQKKIGGVWKYETINKIGNSGKNFTIVFMGSVNAFKDQPEPFQKEWERLKNVKVIQVNSPAWDDAISTLEAEEEVTDANEEMMIFIMNVKEMEKISSDVVLDGAVEREVKRLNRMIEMFSGKFGNWIIVIPPMPDKLANVIRKLSTKIEGEVKAKVCNLFEVQKEKEDEGYEKGSDLWEDEKEELSCVGERYILSVMANQAAKMKNGVAKEICKQCGLIHPIGMCPKELKSRKRRNEKGTEDESPIKKEKQNKNDQERRPQGARESRQNEGRKNNKEDDRDGKAEPKNKRKKSPAGRDTKTDRDVKTEKSDRDVKTEKCPKCLQNHYVDECWVGRHFKCMSCGDTGHHRNIHYPRTEKGKEMIDIIYHGKIDFPNN